MLIEKKNLKLLILPLIVILLGVLYFWLWRFSGLPEYRDLIGIAQELLSSYGLWVVGIAAFIEGILLIGNYLPGGLVIFLAVISAGDDVVKIAAIILLVSLGFAVANICNYLLGRFGWYNVLIKFGMGNLLIKAEQKWKKQSFRVIFFSYWQSNLAALTATAAGVLKINFQKFLKEALLSVIFWNIFWTLVVYLLREQAVNAITNIYIIFGLIVIWAGYITIKKYRKLKHGT